MRKILSVYRLGAPVLLIGSLIAGAAQAMHVEMVTSMRVAKEIKTVLSSDALQPALNGHFITGFTYQSDRLTVSAGACIVQMDIKEVTPETVKVTNDRFSGHCEEVIPRVVESVLASTTAECADHGDASTHPYAYEQWINILSAAAAAPFEPDHYVKELTYTAPDTITLTSENGMSDSGSITGDILPNLDDLLED